MTVGTWPVSHQDLWGQDVRRPTGNEMMLYPAAVPAMTLDEIYDPFVGSIGSRADLRAGDSEVEAAEWVKAAIWPLIELQHNWDSYGGRAVELGVASAAERLLAPLLVQGVPAPSFVPTSDGGLSLEWHRPEFELVIDLKASQDEGSIGSAFFSDDTSGEEWELELVAAGPQLVTALTRLVDWPE